MSTQLLVLVGAGAHAKVILETIRTLVRFSVIGLVDPHPLSSHLLGEPILGGDDVLPNLHGQGITSAVVALGDNTLRQRVAEKLSGLGFTLPPIVHPSAFLSPSVRIGAGSVVMARAVIGTDTIIDELAIVNTGAVIDHDNIIGTAAHVASGSALAGRVRIGARALIGVGSSIRPGVSIGEDAIVGAGSAVVSDVPAKTTVGGVPARPLRSVQSA